MEIGMTAAVGGMQKALGENAARAQRIAKASLSTEEGVGDFTRDLAELPQDAAAFKANAATVKTQDQMLGALLDIIA